MPLFSFFLQAASNLPLRCSEVKSGQTKTTRSDCQSPHPISCLVPATLFSYGFLLLQGMPIFNSGECFYLSDSSLDLCVGHSS